MKKDKIKVVKPEDGYCPLFEIKEANCNGCVFVKYKCIGDDLEIIGCNEKTDVV